MAEFFDSTIVCNNRRTLSDNHLAAMNPIRALRTACWLALAGFVLTAFGTIPLSPSES